MPRQRSVRRMVKSREVINQLRWIMVFEYCEGLMLLSLAYGTFASDLLRLAFLRQRLCSFTFFLGLLLVGCLSSQQHASVSQGRICTDNFTCCHTEIEAADQTFHLTQSQYTDTGPTSPSADPITPGAWQGSHWSANFEVTGMTRPRKIPALAGFEPGTSRSRGGRLNH